MPLKSVKQQIPQNSDLGHTMEEFGRMMNHSIKIGLRHNRSTVKSLAYHELGEYDLITSYRLAAMSQACGRLSQMKRSIRRGRVKIRSFVVNESGLSICIEKMVCKVKCNGMVGIDRNLRNVTCGNDDDITIYKTGELVSLKNTIHSRAEFHRNDRRVKRSFYKDRCRQMSKRTQQYLHKILKDIVDSAAKTKSAIAFENLKGINSMYKKTSGQGNDYRRKLSGWPYYEIKRQIEYKAGWEGIPVIEDPRRTSILSNMREENPRGQKTQAKKIVH